MYEFFVDGQNLLMRYKPSRKNHGWLTRPLECDEEIPLLGRSFYVRTDICVNDVDDSSSQYDFVIGRLFGETGDYFQIDRRVLDIEFDLYMHKSLNFRLDAFVAERDISIFRSFAKHGLTYLYIGGERPDALPVTAFEELIKQFPNSYELNLYAQARVSAAIRNYIPLKVDPEAAFVKYRNRKASLKGSTPKNVLAPYETDKFGLLVDKVEEMMKNAEAYSETRWQEEILQVLLFIFPKYVRAFREAPVRDSLANKQRKIDFLLVDASGYVDALEIKKPFAECMVTSNCYRDNHVPMRQLSGTIMQVEKYVYHLNRSGQAGEAILNKRYATDLPPGLPLRIVNPSGLIVMGRDNSFTAEQRMDFEIIRRKYRHVVEIMTYDDLLRRLKVIRDQFKISPPSLPPSPAPPPPAS